MERHLAAIFSIGGASPDAANFCAPARRRTGADGVSRSCFTRDELKALVLAYNESVEGLARPIRVVLPGTEHEDARVLHAALRARLRDVCADDQCVLDQRWLMDSLKRILGANKVRALLCRALKPLGPRDTSDWLRTADIERVLRQYEQLFPDFKFHGVYPSNYFSEYPETYPAADVQAFARGAFVFNLDKIGQKGSHWVAVFFEHATARVDYFDSTGRKPTRPLERFLHTYFAPPQWRLRVSRKQHQRNDSECGVYAIFYILSRLQGFDPSATARRITDRDMNAFRRALFNARPR